LGNFYSKSVEGNDVFIPPEQLQAFEDTHLIGPVDWVICALKSTALDAIPKLIRPLLHSETRILNIMNGLVDDDIVVMINQSNDANDKSNNQVSCCAAIYGGMALLCSNRVATGHIHHSYAGLLSGGLAASRPGTTTQEHETAFLALWQPSKVPVVYETSLTKGRWKKNIWNLPFNGISVAMGGITIDIIVNDPGLRALAEVIMEEVVTIANTDLKERGYEDTSFHLGKADMKQMMDLSDAMGPYKTSTMLDLVERKPMEVTYLFRKPLQRASELGISAPHLETIVRMIEAYQNIYRL
jgi:2-dehydropantoate 2-reductase